jgi:hypothetical protein
MPTREAPPVVQVFADYVLEGTLRPEDFSGFYTNCMGTKPDRVTTLEAAEHLLSRGASPVATFVSYDGEYPNLCAGDLVVSVSGLEVKFSNPLSSGGSVTFTGDWDEVITLGPWRFDNAIIPQCPLLQREIEALVNTHIPLGCCGGCV